MKLSSPALQSLMEKLEAQPTIASTTPGKRCSECGLLFIITYGSNTRKWHIFHAGGPDGRACARYRDMCPQHLSQQSAIDYANQL